MAAWQRRNQRAEANMLGSHCDGGERHPGIGDRTVWLCLQVVPEEETIPARAFGLIRQIGKLASIGKRVEGRKVDSETHGYLLELRMKIPLYSCTVANCGMHNSPCRLAGEWEIRDETGVECYSCLVAFKRKRLVLGVVERVVDGAARVRRFERVDHAGDVGGDLREHVRQPLFG